ncbi:MAG: NAD(P)H-dependent glycerol-3-phosphate dehydrogenase [Planctomycetaceae bacterium]|nr:NAD(P)-dependent glycerol-3-phosphate dehydrogenase [Planctomycetaceae bacterium]
MREQVSIIGDGAMGTVCALMLAENGVSVRLWSAFPDAAECLARQRDNTRFLPGHPLPDCVEVTGDDTRALAGATLAISAVPTQFMRGVWDRLKCHCPEGLPVCSVTKGIENHTLLLPTQILSDVLDGGRDGSRPLAALSGPSIAPEVADHRLAVVTVAADDESLARRVQQIVNRPYFRVYTNADLVGVELAGAVKNVIAIAAGMLDGLGAGVNTKAALLTRGLVEMARLGAAMGGREETFAGLAGMGDLVTTCFSPIGRNRSFGEAVGRGKSVKDVLAASESVVEGVATTTSVIELAGRLKVEMPITTAVHHVLEGKGTPDEAIAALMSRPLRAEQ